MSELKTLKELDFCKYFNHCVHPDLKCQEECFSEDIKEDLKQEAIKEIKQFQKEVHLTERRIGKSFINGKINYIINKFNITPEDLK